MVHEVGRRRSVLEHSLEIAEVLREVEGGDGDRRPLYTNFGKKILKVPIVYLLVSLSWQQDTGV